ncbi:MAG: NERD domain-containing protein, partial [Polyangiales bacterium]
MSTTGLWPREAPRTTASAGEVRVWEALGEHLPDGWAAWHSMRIRDARGIDGEGDFVIAAPGRGMLVLEVKGGRVEVRDGRWLQNGHAMKRAPREQALGYAHKLVDRLRAQGCSAPAFGVATCFPDARFDRDPGQDDVRGWVATEIDKLLSEGLRPEDIAIVSVRGQTAEDAVIRRDKLGRHPLVSADDDAMDRNVVAETFLRFKGLERPAVIGVQEGYVHQ